MKKRYIAIAVLYLFAAAAASLYLAAGNGTHVSAGYVFSDINVDYDNNGTIIATESFIAFHGRSSTVAEAMTPFTYSLLAGQFIVMALEQPGYTNHFVRMAFECAVLPMMAGQSAVLARVADAEKVALIMFLTAMMCVVVAILDTLASAPDGRKNEERVGLVNGIVGLPAVPRWFSLTMLGATFCFLWIVVLTNLAWQHNHDHLRDSTFVLSLCIMFLTLVHRAVSLLSAAGVWARTREEWMHALVACLCALYGWVLVSAN